MSDNNTDNRSEGRFLRISTIVVLLVLLAISGLLAFQNWRLLQELASVTQPVATPTPAANLVPPAPEPPPAPVLKPVPVAAAKKPSPPATAKRNYTQPEVVLAPAAPVAADAVPAPVARVYPTDVIPAQPIPFPRTAPQASSRPEKMTATLSPGSVFTVRLLDTLNTERNQAGDTFRASLDEPIIFDGNVVAPRGTTVEGIIVDTQQAGRVKGVAEMTLKLNQLRLPSGETVVLETGTIRREGETSMGEDTAKVGAGAAIGAVLGAIGGGGKGAAIGAASGAGAGTAGVLLTRGKPLILSQETVLSFSLNSPATFTYMPGQQPDSYTDIPTQRAPQPGDWDRDRPVLRRQR
jgi:hypothetical protein